jgi:hypothetical protein
VITLLKTVTAAYHGMKLLEMKYNSALAVQRTAELAQRTANTGAIAAETSALLANTAARTANAASGASGTAVSMASGGFKAGFDSVFNVSLKSFTKFFSRLMHPIKTLQTILHAAKIGGAFSAIGAAFMKIGVIVGKTAGFFKAAFTVIAGAVSFMKVAIVGGVMAIVGVVDILQSLFRTGNWFDGSVILRPIANFLTGYNKEVERANNIERNMREWKNSMTIEKEVAEFEHNIQASLVSIFSQDIFKDASVKQQISSNFSGLSGAMISYKRKEVEDKERIAIAKEDLKNASRLVRIAIENKKSQEEINDAVKKRNEAQENLQKIEADFRERQGLITSEYQKLIDTVKAQQEAQKNIIKTFDEYRYSMASDAQKKIIQENRYATELNNFQTAIRDKNFSVAEGALKNMMSAHNSLMEMANASIKTYKQLFDDTENDMFNFLLESYTKTNDKVNALRAKAGQMYMESGVSFNAGQVQISSGANADLTASYKKAKTAIDLNIRALKLEIGEKQKLAQAEARVNQNTLQLINSMNKFSSTAVDAVNALSADAVKLQSRNFEKLPAFAPQQQQQLGLEKLQADLSAAYQRARDVAEAFNQEAGKRKTEAENQKASLEVQMAGFMQKVETHTADLAKNFAPIQASLQDLAHKMSSLKPEEVEKRLRSIEGALKNFGAVTF